MSKSEKELSRKSYEVVVHLEPTKAYGSDSDHDLSDTEEDASGRPICNTWKGQNYELPVIGSFQSDFMRRLKTYQVPSLVDIRMDPFCRHDAGFEDDEPLMDDAFLVWENPGFPNLLKNREPQLRPARPLFGIHWDIGDVSSDSEVSETPDKVETSPKSSKSNINVNPDNYEDCDSEVEPEIDEYIQNLEEKRSTGSSVSDETLFYDSDYDVIRNLHSSSISLTSYGTTVEASYFGKSHYLFDQLSPEEKKLNQARYPEEERMEENCIMKLTHSKDRAKTRKDKEPVKNTIGSGDY